MYSLSFEEEEKHLYTLQEAAKAVTVIENDISISTTEITQSDHSG